MEENVPLSLPKGVITTTVSPSPSAVATKTVTKRKDVICKVCSKSFVPFDLESPADLCSDTCVVRERKKNRCLTCGCDLYIASKNPRLVAEGFCSGRCRTKFRRRYDKEMNTLIAQKEADLDGATIREEPEDDDDDDDGNKDAELTESDSEHHSSTAADTAVMPPPATRSSSQTSSDQIRMEGTCHICDKAFSYFKKPGIGGRGRRYCSDICHQKAVNINRNKQQALKGRHRILPEEPPVKKDQYGRVHAICTVCKNAFVYQKIGRIQIYCTMACRNRAKSDIAKKRRLLPSTDDDVVGADEENDGEEETAGGDDQDHTSAVNAVNGGEKAKTTTTTTTPNLPTTTTTTTATATATGSPSNKRRKISHSHNTSTSTPGKASVAVVHNAGANGIAHAHTNNISSVMSKTIIMRPIVSTPIVAATAVPPPSTAIPTAIPTAVPRPSTAVPPPPIPITSTAATAAAAAAAAATSLTRSTPPPPPAPTANQPTSTTTTTTTSTISPAPTHTLMANTIPPTNRIIPTALPIPRSPSPPPAQPLSSPPPTTPSATQQTVFADGRQIQLEIERRGKEELDCKTKYEALLAQDVTYAQQIESLTQTRKRHQTEIHTMKMKWQECTRMNGEFCVKHKDRLTQLTKVFDEEMAQKKKEQEELARRIQDMEQYRKAMTDTLKQLSS